MQLTVEIKVLTLALPWTKSFTLTNSFFFFFLVTLDIVSENKNKTNRGTSKQ